MNLKSAIATVSTLVALYLPATGTVAIQTKAESIKPSPAQVTLSGPLKGYVVINKTSQSVEDVVTSLKKELAINNFLVKAIIDHQAIAKTQGLEVPPNTALLVGLPSFEAPIIKSNSAASLFVPLTVAVWRENAMTYIVYWNPNTDLKTNLGPFGKDANNVVDSMTVTLKKMIEGILQ